MSETVKGTITSKSRRGDGIQINKTNWYNGTVDQLAGVNWKDEVELVVEGKKILEVKKVDGGGASGGGAAKAPNVDWDARQNSIEYQSARRDAITLAAAMIEAGVVALPAAKDKKYDAYLELVGDLTVRLFQAPIPPKVPEAG
jgi:hypothetical protein